MEFPYHSISKSPDATKAIAVEFAAVLLPGDIIALVGNLGVGKTFFVRRAAEFLGVKSIASPTFSLINEYSGNFKIAHVDFYRIKSKTEIYDIGFNDYISDEESIVFIEWADLFPELLPVNFYSIRIESLGDEKREIYIERHG